MTEPRKPRPKKRKTDDTPAGKPRKAPKWQTCDTCGKRVNTNDGTNGTHTCYHAEPTGTEWDAWDDRRTPLTLRSVASRALTRVAYWLIKLAHRIGPFALAFVVGCSAPTAPMLDAPQEAGPILTKRIATRLDAPNLDCTMQLVPQPITIHGVTYVEWVLVAVCP